MTLASCTVCTTMARVTSLPQWRRFMSSEKKEEGLRPLTRELNWQGLKMMVQELPPKAKELQIPPQTVINRPPKAKLTFLGRAGKETHKVFAQAKKENQLEATSESLQKLSKYYREHHELNVMQVHPMMTKENFQAILDKTCKELGANSVATAAIKGFAAQKRIKLIVQTATLFMQLVAEERNEVHALVVSAQELSPSQMSAIEKRMRTVVDPHEKLIVSRQVDPSLLGGFIWRIGSIQQDLSIKTQLHSFKNNLTQYFSTNPNAVARYVTGV